jgi:hypothetical protein
MPVMVGIAASVLGLICLGLAIVRLVRIARAEPVLRVPLVAEQYVSLPAGVMQLNVEGPHLTTKFAGLSYALIDRASGSEVPLSTVWLRTRTSGMQRARLSICRFELATAGAYVLRVAGFDATTSYADCALVVNQPASIALPIAIVGIVLSAALVIGGIVMTALSVRDAPFDPDKVPLSSLPEAPASGGRQLRSDRTAAPVWREVRWDPGRLRLEVPADWNERKQHASELDLRPPTQQATFVRVRVSTAPDISPEDFLKVARVQAASRLAGSRIVGYSVKSLGSASGVLSFERGKEDTKEQLVWTSIVPGTSQIITIFLGAATENFAQAEPVLGAILESMRIE